MALSTKNSEQERAKRELEGRVGIKRVVETRDDDDPLASIRYVQKRYAARKSQNRLSDDDILGYDANGIPTK